MNVLLKACRSGRGVSLMETLVALFILSVVGVAVIAGIQTTVLANELARTKISAESLARTELEYVNSQPYETGTLDYTLPGSPTYPAGWDTAHAMPAGYSGYSVHVYADANIAGDKSSMRKVTAVVGYDNGSGTREVLRISMYQAEIK